MTKETFFEKRFQFYTEQNWEAYEDLLLWEYELQERAFNESMDQVCEELQVDKMLILASNIKHGTNLATMSALNDHISDQEKNKKPKLT